MRLSSIVYALAVFLLTANSTSAQVNYYLYDDLGRLSLASFPDGSVVLYSYDANGNRELALQYGASTPVIESFSPSSGQAGISVTIDGAGFSATPALNAVTIGGVGATVTSASETELVVTVPLGAVTGPIAASTGGPAIPSLENFTVLTPVINGFSPVLVNPQNDVTIQGQNFNLVPGQTAVSVGGVAANIRSITNGSLVIDATSASGQILIDTPYGDALSASSLIVVPSAIDPEDVVDTSVITVNGSANLQMAQQSGYGVLEFAGTSGQWLRVRVTSLQTSPGSAPVNYAVYSPSGSSIATGSFTSTTLVPIFLPKLTATGTHYIAFYSATSSLTDMSIALDAYSGQAGHRFRFKTVTHSGGSRSV